MLEATALTTLQTCAKSWCWAARQATTSRSSTTSTSWDVDESFTADGGADFDTCSPYDPAFCESELTLLPAECMPVTESASR